MSESHKRALNKAKRRNNTNVLKNKGEYAAQSIFIVYIYRVLKISDRRMCCISLKCRVVNLLT